MDKTNFKSHLGIAIILGSLWGFAEVALGLGLRSCAALVSGSLMTGVALFFICAGWVSTRRFIVPVLIVIITCLFKLFDAYLLQYPIIHGAIANPMFAFLMEGFAFILLIALIGYHRWQKKIARILLGAGAALIAVSLFPLVKFATGIPACVYPGTTIPLSIFFAPVAIVFSAITVPLGFVAGEKISSSADNIEIALRSRLIRQMVTPVTLLLCLALVVVIRLITSTSLPA
ncbi:MAG: hypothetical protein AMS27_15680 [Bacteroides sp. SM23_62_1]|nr:MAG: hypothetical protein AMS27_15680 [Bacteroides sp. SM23_62_1]